MQLQLHMVYIWYIPLQHDFKECTFVYSISFSKLLYNNLQEPSASPNWMVPSSDTGLTIISISSVIKKNLNLWNPFPKAIKWRIKKTNIYKQDSSYTFHIYCKLRDICCCLSQSEINGVLWHECFFYTAQQYIKRIISHWPTTSGVASTFAAWGGLSVCRSLHISTATRWQANKK